MVPKLRFSKFSQKWTKIRLGNYLQNYQKKVPSDTDIPVYSSSRQGLKPQSEYFADRELQNDGEYSVVPFGYITYRHMSDDNTFHFNINDKLPEIAVSKEYPVFTGKGLNNYFLLSKLNYSNEFKLFAIQQKAGGTRTRLYFKNLSEWRGTFPDLEEQAQIADFLSSADEKITLLNKQYDLICQYKKGMMQKIFSQKVRFKDENGEEFPGWDRKFISNILTIGSGRDYKHLNDGNVPVFGTGGFMTMVDQFLFEGETVCIGRKGTIDKPFYYNGKIWTVDTLFYTYEFKGVHPKFVYQLFLTINWKEYNEASGVPSLSKKTIEKIEVNIPCLSEQKKISRFLSALDDKIAVKKAELDKLKTWKQGLLQQMFV